MHWNGTALVLNNTTNSTFVLIYHHLLGCLNFFFLEVGTMVLSNFQTSTKLHLFSLEVCILIVNDVCKSIHITCEKNLTSKIMFILFIQFANLFIFSFSYSGWHCESHRTSPMGFSLEWYGRWFKISLGELV